MTITRARALDLLDETERKRHDRFKSPKRQGEFAITRALLRMVVASVLRSDPASVAFAHTEHGKPYLPDHPVHFNVTHSADMALIAVSPDFAIGVDIECHRPRENFQKMAKRFFSPAEFDALMKLPADKQFRAFHTIWTRKEAFVKAIAKGITLGLDQFTVNVDPDEPACLMHKPDHITETWALHIWSISDTFKKKILDEKIEDTAGSYAWADDHQTIFYVKRDETTLRAFAGLDREWDEWIRWFRELPFYLDLGNLRVVHATWHRDSIRFLKGKSLADDDFLKSSVCPDTPEFESVEIVLKGLEIPLPDGNFYEDKQGFRRSCSRVKWWECPDTLSYRDAVFPFCDTVSDDLIDRFRLDL